MPRAIKKRSAKKNAPAEIDVKDRLSEIQTRLKEKRKTVMIYSIAAVVIAAAIAGGIFYRYSTESESKQLEYEAYKIYYNEYQKNTLSRQEQFGKALDLFTKAYSQNKSPRTLLYIANSQFELGKLDEALKSLSMFTRDYSRQTDLMPLALQKIAAIYLKKGDKNEALKSLDALYKAPGSIYKDYALVESARILESEGKKDEATARYKELAEKFKDSPFVEEAKAKIAEKKEG